MFRLSAKARVLLKEKSVVPGGSVASLRIGSYELMENCNFVVRQPGVFFSRGGVHDKAD